ncbi:MAG: hypothetical protein LBM00_11610 [Deltaproteobacteria bacterium]|jgi:hypothetical protein|nr:hypothetical protein [Deltaproteobacteria bacterium]
MYVTRSDTKKVKTLIPVLAVLFLLTGGRIVSSAQSAVFPCKGGVTASVDGGDAYYFITNDIHELQSCIARTDKNLEGQSWREIPFRGLALGIYGREMLAAGIGKNDENDEKRLGFYKQKDNTLEFFELYRQSLGRVLAAAKAADFGLIVCYEKEGDLFKTHVATFKHGGSNFGKCKAPLHFSLIENPSCIIPVPSSEIFFVTLDREPGKQLPISRFNADCVLLETRLLEELLPDAPSMNTLSGRALTKDSLLLWGIVEPAQWWFGVYDIRKNAVLKTAVVTPGDGIMPALIYDVAVLKDGRLCLCTPAVLFLLNADFAPESYWTAWPGGETPPPGYNALSITEDGNLLVMGSSIVERSGQAAVWLVRPQDFQPLPAEY